MTTLHLCRIQRENDIATDLILNLNQLILLFGSLQVLIFHRILFAYFYAILCSLSNKSKSKYCHIQKTKISWKFKEISNERSYKFPDSSLFTKYLKA